MDSLQNGDSLVMLWLVSWLTRHSLHRIIVTRASAFGKRNELRKRFCHAEVRNFSSSIVSLLFSLVEIWISVDGLNVHLRVLQTEKDFSS